MLTDAIIEPALNDVGIACNGYYANNSKAL